MLSSSIAIVFMFLIWSFNSHTLLIMALLLGAFSAAGRIVIGFVWVQDFMSPKGIDVATPILFFLDGLTTLFASIYFRYINKDWRWFIASAIVPMILSLLSLFCSSESPKYYHDKFMFEEAREVLTAVGHVNGTIPPGERFIKKFETEIQIENMQDKIKDKMGAEVLGLMREASGNRQERIVEDDEDELVPK